MLSNARTIPTLILSTAILVTCGCDRSKPSKGAAASASAAVSSVPAASTKPVEKKPSFEALVAKSQPVTPAPKALEVGGHTLTPQHCSIEGTTFLDESPLNVLKAVEVVGDHLYVVDTDGAVLRFRVGEGDACVLKLDTAFGDEGKLAPDRAITDVSAGADGRIVASNYALGSFVIEDGKVAFGCDARGVVRMSPKGGWGIASYANGPVRKVTYESKACKAEPWVIADLSRPKTRKGPFSNVNTVGFAGSLVLVGGVLADETTDRQAKVVVGYDAKGEEKLRFGNVDKTARDDNFGWIHGIAACAPGICVLDSNYRRLTVWKKDGSFVGNAKLSDLFGVRYPWVPSMAADKDTLYFVAGQDRGPKSGVAEGLVFRVAIR